MIIVLKESNAKEQHQETNLYAKSSPSDHVFNYLIFLESLYK